MPIWMGASKGSNKVAPAIHPVTDVPADELELEEFKRPTAGRKTVARDQAPHTTRRPPRFGSNIRWPAMYAGRRAGEVLPVRAASLRATIDATAN